MVYKERPPRYGHTETVRAVQTRTRSQTASLKIVHEVLHQALKQAMINGYIRFNPAEACKLPGIEKKGIVPLNEAQTMK